MPGGMPPQPPGQATGPAGQPLGQPQPAAPYPGQVAGGYGPGAPATPGPSGGGKGRGPLWALGGAIVASAVWAGVLFATGGFGDDDPKADLGGYAYTGDLCKATDYGPFEDAGYTKETPSSGSSSSSSDKNPRSSGVEDKALDTMQCNTSFKANNASSSDYSSTWLTSSALLHRKTDPAPEFEAQYRAYESQSSATYSYQVTEVPDIGDEAYLVTQVKKDSKDDGSYVILGVRDGWMTYQSSWSNYTSSSSTVTPPDSKKVGKMLARSAEATMERLQGEASDEQKKKDE